MSFGPVLEEVTVMLGRQACMKCFKYFVQTGERGDMQASSEPGTSPGKVPPKKVCLGGFLRDE